MPLQQILENIRPKISNVRLAINGRPAGVHRNVWWIERGEILQLPRVGVEQPDHGSHNGHPERKRQSGSDRGIPWKFPLSFRGGISRLPCAPLGMTITLPPRSPPRLRSSLHRARLPPIPHSLSL